MRVFTDYEPQPSLVVIGSRNVGLHRCSNNICVDPPTRNKRHDNFWARETCKGSGNLDLDGAYLRKTLQKK